MFNSYEFIFAGVPSSMYGLMVCDFGGNSHSDNAFGNSAEILETRIQGRVRPLHYGVDYHKEPLSFKLVFGSERQLDRWDLQDISYWLTGHQQYQWLSIEQPDLAHVEFRCLITKLTPISVGWVPYAFEAEVTCDCPYAYGLPFEHRENFYDGDIIHLYNDSTARVMCFPEMVIRPANGCTEIAITNVSDNGKVFKLSEIPASVSEIYVDNDNCIIRATDNIDLYNGFNDCFFGLVPGDNTLEMLGSGTITVSGRYFYNVGA